MECIEFNYFLVKYLSVCFSSFFSLYATYTVNKDVYIDWPGPIVWTTARHRTGPPRERTVIAKGRQSKYVQQQVGGRLQPALLGPYVYCY